MTVSPSSRSRLFCLIWLGIGMWVIALGCICFPGHAYLDETAQASDIRFFDHGFVLTIEPIEEYIGYIPLTVQYVDHTGHPGTTKLYPKVSKGNHTIDLSVEYHDIQNVDYVTSLTVEMKRHGAILYLQLSLDYKDGEYSLAEKNVMQHANY